MQACIAISQNVKGELSDDRAAGCRQVKKARLAASLASIEVFSSGVILRSV